MRDRDCDLISDSTSVVKGNSDALAHQEGPSNIPSQVSDCSTDIIGTQCTHDYETTAGQ